MPEKSKTNSRMPDAHAVLQNIPRKLAAIFGAGQAGQMLLKLLRNEHYEVVAFVDNNFAGIILDGLPVVGIRRLAEIHPDLIFIAILNRDAEQEVKEQLLAAGFSGDCIQSISTWREMFDLRVATLRLLAKEIISQDVAGAVAELGVYTGEFAAQINSLFPERTLYLFDTFTGFDDRDVSVEEKYGYSRAHAGKFKDTSEEIVRRKLLHPQQAFFKKGYFPDTATDVCDQFALVSIDADLYKPIYEGLKFFYPRLSHGGYIIVHDFNNSQFRGAGEAVRQFCQEEGLTPVPLCDLHGSTVIAK